MGKRIESVWVKVERAEKHFADLQKALANFSFSEPKPYTIRTKRDPNTRQLIYYVSDLRNIPVVIPAIAGDVIQNLRSALDYAIHWIFRTRFPGEAPLDHFGFPICPSASKYKSAGIGKIKRLGQDVIDVVSAVEPYKGSSSGVFTNGDLWCLHELNNISKHRLLLAVCSQYQMHGVTPRIISELSEKFPDEPLIDFTSAISVDNRLRKIPVKKGYVLYTTPPDCEVEKDMTFHFDVALYEPEVMEIYSILGALQRFTELVKMTLNGLGPFM